MVKVKICGNRSTQDIHAVQGADAAGFIVATPESRRNITIKRAARLVENVSPFTATVLVTTKIDPHILKKMTDRIKPDYLQLHSNMEPDRLEKIAEFIPKGTGLIALLSVTTGEKRITDRARNLAKSSAVAILLDSKVNGETGGTGLVHDWELSRKIRDEIYPFPVILAGGIGPENVVKAIHVVSPYAIDVATGVEQNGVKSARKIKSLLSEVRRVET